MDSTKPQLDVMVADASHKAYVDTILNTNLEAAKVRGKGNSERPHETIAIIIK